MSRSYDQEVVQKVAVTVLSSHCCTDSESERIKKQKNTPIDMSLLGFHCSPPQQSPPRGKTESGTDEKRFVKINTTGTLSIGGKCLLGMIFMSFCGQTSRSTFGKKISSCDFWGGQIIPRFQKCCQVCQIYPFLLRYSIIIIIIDTHEEIKINI